MKSPIHFVKSRKFVRKLTRLKEFTSCWMLGERERNKENEPLISLQFHRGHTVFVMRHNSGFYCIPSEIAVCRRHKWKRYFETSACVFPPTHGYVCVCAGMHERVRKSLEILNRALLKIRRMRAPFLLTSNYIFAYTYILIVLVQSAMNRVIQLGQRF